MVEVATTGTVATSFVVTVVATMVVGPARVVVGRCGLPQSLFAAAARSPFDREDTYSPWLRAFSHVMTLRGTEVLVFGLAVVVVGLVVVVVSVGATVTTTTPMIDVGVCACADPPTPSTTATVASGTRKRFALKGDSSWVTFYDSQTTGVVGQVA